MNSPLLLILTLKLVAMTTSLEPSEKEDQVGKLRSNTTYGENLVKISQVDPKISLLKGLSKKRKKINASRTLPAGHACRASLNKSLLCYMLFGTAITND